MGGYRTSVLRVLGGGESVTGEQNRFVSIADRTAEALDRWLMELSIYLM